MFQFWRQFWIKQRPFRRLRHCRRFLRRRLDIEVLEKRWTPSFTLLGTIGDDVFSFVADGSGYTLTLNGNPQSFTPAQENTFQIVGNGGNDSVTIQGSVATGPQTAHLAPQSGQWNSPSYSLDISDIDSIAVQGSPNDIAYLDDSSGDDVLTAAPPGRATCTACAASTTFQGPGYLNQVLGFDRVEATASTGNDQALLYDSEVDDFYAAYFDFSYIRGINYLNKVSGFDRVDAYASSGYDSAEMSDSSGDDVFGGNVAFSFLSGAGKVNRANGFDRVIAFASTGDDSATFSDSSGDDTFVVEGPLGYLNSQGAPLFKAVGFDRVEAYSASGNDAATLSDSAGNDHFTANPEFGYITGPGYLAKAIGFARIDALSRFGGTDTAALYDSAGDDFFEGSPDYGSMVGQGFSNRASGFDRVDGFASSGADASAIVGSSATESFGASPDFSFLSRPEYVIRANSFSRSQLDSGPGATDTLLIQDSPGDDYVTVSRFGAYASHSGYLLWANGNFSRIDVRGSTGNDEAVLSSGVQGNLLRASSNGVSLDGDGNSYYFEVLNFRLIRAIGLGTLNASHEDRCILFDAPGYSAETDVSGTQLQMFYTDLSQQSATRRLVYTCDNFKRHEIRHANNLGTGYVAYYGPRQISVEVYPRNATGSHTVGSGTDYIQEDW